MSIISVKYLFNIETNSEADVFSEKDVNPLISANSTQASDKVPPKLLLELSSKISSTIFPETYFLKVVLTFCISEISSNDNIYPDLSLSLS